MKRCRSVDVRARLYLSFLISVVPALLPGGRLNAQDVTREIAPEERILDALRMDGHLLVGDTITLHGRDYVIERLLGQGGYKMNYLVRDPTCVDGCRWVVGVYHSMIRAQGLVPTTPQPVSRMLDAGTNPHVRREVARALATIGGQPVTVSVSEFLPHTVSAESTAVFRDPRALNLVAEQLYDAVRAFHDSGYVHLDIKPGNLLLAGTSGPVRLQTLLSGEHYIALADHDVLEVRGTPVGGSIRGSPPYMAPELISPGGVRDTPASLWAVSASLWELYNGGERLLRHPEFLRRAGLEEAPPVPLLTDQQFSILRQVVSSEMTAHAARLRAEGRLGEARSLLRVRDVILNGLHSNPRMRRLDLPQARAGTPLQRARRLIRIRAQHALRRRAWGAAGGCANLGDVGQRLGGG